MGLQQLYNAQPTKISKRKSSIDRVLNDKRFTEILPEETIRGLLMDVDTNIKLSDVILSNENKRKIKTFLTENENRAELLKYDLRPLNRILCYGASGCGKTFMAKALSNEMNYVMLYVDIAQSLSQGKVAINLTNVFKLASVGGCMIFLDECDSIAWNRDSNTPDSADMRRATNSLFQLMDQLTFDSMIICATNMLNRLDPAFERRFDLKMLFSRPSLDLIQSIMHFKKNGFVLINDVPEDELLTIQSRLKTNTKLSYYEIESLTERAMKRAIITKSTVERNNKKQYAIRLRWIIEELKITLNIKRSFKTDLEEVEAYSD